MKLRNWCVGTLLIALCGQFHYSTAADYYVDRAGDVGAGNAGTSSGDLRWCITQTNANPGADRILFNNGAGLSFSGTIVLTGTLPSPTGVVQILGNTAPGYAVNAPTVEINAAAAGWGFLFNNAGAAGSIVRGLAISRATVTNVEANGVNTITIRDCFIGTNIAGTAAAASNPFFGVAIVNSDNSIINNCVISGHTTHGILINTNSDNTTITGNRIGTNNLGTAAIANAFHGIEINNSSTGTIIGGVLAADRNIISGNTHMGIQCINTSSNPSIINNYIGVNDAGTAAIANGEHGIYIDNCGIVTLTSNVISGNAIFGSLIMNCDGHVVRGNKVGTNAAGTAAISNGNAGMSFNNTDNVTIGGTAVGNGNVLSGNGDVGLRFENSINAIIQGNFIGTNATGTGAIGNNSSGIFAITGCNDHLIGGNTPAARNIISCNRIQGIQYMSFCHDLEVKGNYIGTDVSGGGAAATFGNGEVGVMVNNDCLRPVIGGSVAGEGNVISGNGRLWVSGVNNGTGIQFISNVMNAVVQGNIIGLQADGSTLMPNAENGIVLLATCDNALIGGSTSAERNIVSGNGRQGIVINGAHNVDIFGNYCGTDITGALARGNGQSGVILIFSNNSEIGRATAGYGNILSNNSELGLHLVGGNGGTVYNNYIGVAANGTTAMGNKNGGVFIQGVAAGTNGSDYIVGGLGANQPNIVAYSTNTGVNPDLGNGFGIGVAHNEEGLRNTFIGNKIFCNVGKGIDLNFAGSFGGGANGVGNGGKTAPVITSVSATSTSGTGTVGETIHLYANNTCLTCQGEVYLGTVVVGAGGTWTIPHIAVANPTANSATATNATLGTSEFACSVTLPVEFISFEAAVAGKSVQLVWSTSWEKDNAKFIIERSADGENFYPLKEVKGNGTITGAIHYVEYDATPLNGISYYRLRQVDHSGQFQFSDIRSVRINLQEGISIYPNPSREAITIALQSGDLDFQTITITNSLGQEVYFNKNYHAGGITVDITYLPVGIYHVQAFCDEVSFIGKFIKE